MFLVTTNLIDSATLLFLDGAESTEESSAEENQETACSADWTKHTWKRPSANSLAIDLIRKTAPHGLCGASKLSTINQIMSKNTCCVTTSNGRGPF